MNHPLAGPLTRRGPRPLLLHLTLALMREQAKLREKDNPATTSTGSAHNSTASNAGSPGWSAAGFAEQLRDLRTAAANPAIGAFLGAEDGPLRSLIAGIAAYRRHPWQRELTDPPVLWHEGGSRLLDYGGGRRRGGRSPALLMVPSLVNRAFVLDLAEDRSMVRFLAGEGIRVMLMDWGWPGRLERRFDLTDYITGRLARAIAMAAKMSGGPVVLGGYCMGGLLTVAAALRQPEHVAGLALLATPWDFHAAGEDQARAVGGLLPMLEAGMGATESLSIDALQLLFAMMEPEGIAAKYRGFAQLDPESERARMFVALEDWLNDGVPLAAPVARECLAGWYGANAPGRLAWRVGGEVVDPRRVAVPTFAAIPARDRIVPPESARPLAASIPGCKVIEPRAGHIGMAAGSNARTELWEPLRDWIFGP